MLKPLVGREPAGQILFASWPVLPKFVGPEWAADNPLIGKHHLLLAVGALVRAWVAGGVVI